MCHGSVSWRSAVYHPFVRHSHEAALCGHHAGYHGNGPYRYVRLCSMQHWTVFDTLIEQSVRNCNLNVRNRTSLYVTEPPANDVHQELKRCRRRQQYQHPSENIISNGIGRRRCREAAPGWRQRPALQCLLMSASLNGNYLSLVVP